MTQTVPEQRSEEQLLSNVYVAWQYRADPESAQRVYQFLGVFSTPEIARAKTASMRSSSWTLEIIQTSLDPEEVC